jgi:peptide chain release factor 2
MAGAPQSAGAPGKEEDTWIESSNRKNCKSASRTSRSAFDVAKLATEIDTLDRQSAAPDFWDDPQTARSALATLKHHRDWVDPVRRLETRLVELVELGQMARAESDSATLADVERDLQQIAVELEELEFRLMLGGEDDDKNALLVIHPGAGGLESQDWAEMLLRMYSRYCERHEWGYETLDLQAGEGAGIKSVTLEITGDFAYGRLKSETGVHRLIRISPFDANQRRHTSFVSIFVYPEVESDVKVEIRDADLRIDTYRASGAGGQHVNKTSSAVRITHLPTKIVVQCQNERSQLRNRESAMKILRARLYQHLKEEEEVRRAEKEPEKKEIGFGSQIRTYTFQPYTLVKDHRTGVETGDVQAVMDGELDEFVEGYLKWANEVRQGPR